MGGITSTITAKDIFRPPNPPSYKIVSDQQTQKLRFERIPPADDVEVLLLNTKRRQKIAAMFVYNQSAKLTILHSHGNGCDLCQMRSFYIELSNTLHVNVLGYDYSGYGASSGQPSEANTFADIEAAFNCLINDFNIQQEDIILFGQSLGSGPTVHLASSKARVRSVVLHSPFLSGLQILSEKKKKKFPRFQSNFFVNIDKIPKVECPVFVIHGVADEVVNVSHGQKLAQLCKVPYEPLFIERGHHNDLNFFPEFFDGLCKFVSFAEQHPPPESALPKKPDKRFLSSFQNGI